MFEKGTDGNLQTQKHEEFKDHKHSMLVQYHSAEEFWLDLLSIKYKCIYLSVSVDYEDIVPQSRGCLSFCINIMFQWFSTLHRLNLLLLRRVGVEAEVSLTEPQQTKPKSVCTAGNDPETWCNCVISCSLSDLKRVCVLRFLWILNVFWLRSRWSSERVCVKVNKGNEKSEKKFEFSVKEHKFNVFSFL